MLQGLDTALFRLINQSMANPLFDWILPPFNGGALFKQIGLIAAVLLAWRGGGRMRICLIFIALSLAIGDGLVCGTIKRAVGRPRPFVQFQDARLLTGKGSSGSMPSSHAANTTAVAIVLAVFYPRTRRLMTTVTFLVCLARVYSGVHFPSDVIAGAMLAGIYTPAILYGVERLWRSKASLLFPNLAQRLPSLLNPPLALPV